MGGKDKAGDKRTPPLAPGDAELWEKVAATARPLRKGKNRAVKRPEMPERPEIPPVEAKETAKPPPPSAKPAAAPRAAPPPGALSRRDVRELGGGRRHVDARLDLHGLRQREAHTLLKGFLARAQTRGHRTVLVITGKGGNGGGGEGTRERGVLNREVPRWLAEPEFRQWVVSFAPAHKRHGGEGALYVRIRRRKP